MSALSRIIGILLLLPLVYGIALVVVLGAKGVGVEIDRVVIARCVLEAIGEYLGTPIRVEQGPPAAGRRQRQSGVN